MGGALSSDDVRLFVCLSVCLSVCMRPVASPCMRGATWLQFASMLSPRPIYQWMDGDWLADCGLSICRWWSDGSAGTVLSTCFVYSLPGCTKKFDLGLSQVMHVNLHWLDVPELVKYKLVTMVTDGVQLSPCNAPSYLTDCCTSISDVRRHLRSVSRRQLLVLRHNLHIWSSSFFAWNCMSDELREPLLTANSFRQLLKTRLFAEY